MASKFTGRDYSTLRAEIIDFLAQRLPSEWDSTNLSDPVVIFAESLAKMGDQLHYTIDELRRECDMATAKRASSIYSYAMREGYKMMLPRGSFGTILLNSNEQSDRIEININKFDEIKTTIGETLIVANNVSGSIHKAVDTSYADSLLKQESYLPGDYSAYVNSINERTIRIPVVLGSKETFNFTFNDINTDSTVDLPDSIIDRDLILLTTTSTKTNNGAGCLEYVDDIIGSGFKRYSYTITPKFIGGAITLCIEFPTNYRDLFNASDTFTFSYVKIKDASIDDTESNAKSILLDNFISPVEGHSEDQDIVDGFKYTISLADGIKGYTEYENPNVTRENYKKFVQDYSALLTKDDYTSYIKATTSQHCKVFDHSDNYKEDKVPPGTELIPRTVYIITDTDYDGRKNLWYDLIERSSRSDCILMIPFGKDPYSIVVKAECYLLGTSVSAIATQIKSALLQYYGSSLGEKIPENSVINYLVHKASDKVIRMDSCIIRDSTYGTIDKTFKDITLLNNDDIDTLYDVLCIKEGDSIHSYDSNHQDKYLEYIISDLPDTVDVPVTEEYFLANPDSFSEYSSYNDYLYRNFENFYVQLYSINYNPYRQTSFEQYYKSNFGCIKYRPVEYKNFPDEFPKVYYVPDDEHENGPILDYDTLVEYQIDYGLLDRPSWDIKDTEIFTEDSSPVNIRHASGWLEVTSYTDPPGYPQTPVSILGYVKKSDTDFASSFSTTATITNESGALVYNTPNEADPMLNESNTQRRILYNSSIVCSEKKYNVSLPVNASIDEKYKRHHYMVPVLNNVIVLIKAVTK